MIEHYQPITHHTSRITRAPQGARHDNASRITTITHNGPSGVIENLSYPYDSAGNRISLMRSNGTASLLPAAVQAAYDAVSRPAVRTSDALRFAGGFETIVLDRVTS